MCTLTGRPLPLAGREDAPTGEPEASRTPKARKALGRPGALALGLLWPKAGAGKNHSIEGVTKSPLLQQLTPSRDRNALPPKSAGLRGWLPLRHPTTPP